ncbi:cytochrome c oxidase assembly factor 3 homolog, mitochondrial [Hippoglossus stenolepis]|uniref:cytochrome c oxidase assembly factor 3 homolog, mitochondrial n=1 Tax=Hippoglossus stenolepis TaxID=195615 RepID=UPI001FAFF319|nr:cytochrome c oxidase assembly factor 3 homolog, mitochondrial [Hippoglossus stenolepis]
MEEKSSGPGDRTGTAAEKLRLLRQQELELWRKNAPRLRRRNLITGLGIGAFVVGMFTYTILSVKQERIVEELDEESRIRIYRGPRTGANS